MYERKFDSREFSFDVIRGKKISRIIVTHFFCWMAKNCGQVWGRRWESKDSAINRGEFYYERRRNKKKMRRAIYYQIAMSWKNIQIASISAKFPSFVSLHSSYANIFLRNPTRLGRKKICHAAQFSSDAIESFCFNFGFFFVRSCVFIFLFYRCGEIRHETQFSELNVINFGK